MNMAGKPGVKKEFFVYQLVPYIYIRFFDTLTWSVTSLFFWHLGLVHCYLFLSIYTLYRMLFSFSDAEDKDKDKEKFMILGVGLVQF